MEQIGLKTDTGDVKKLCFCTKSMFYFCTKQRRKVYPICQFNDTRKLVGHQKNRDKTPDTPNEISLKTPMDDNSDKCVLSTLLTISSLLTLNSAIISVPLLIIRLDTR